MHAYAKRGSRASSNSRVCGLMPCPPLAPAGDIPRSNVAFIADALASMMGGLLGSSGAGLSSSSASNPAGAHLGWLGSIHVHVCMCVRVW